MDRLYRVALDGRPTFVVERDGEWWHAVAARRAGVPGIAVEDGRDIFAGYTLGEVVRQPRENLKLLTPVHPSKIVCVGLNYKDHAAEVGKPLPPQPQVFMKPPSALLDPGGTIALPAGVGRVDYEGELAVVIGRRARRVSPERVWDHIFGLTCLNDVTARDMQKKESQFTRSKGFDTFAPLGACIAVGANGTPRMVETWVNGARRQASSSGELIFGIEELVAFISFAMTLEPGDVISTGTPAGISPLSDGDRVTVKIEGVGELTNVVAAE